MKRLIILGLAVCFGNAAVAGEGTYTGTIDMTMPQGNQVKYERVADSNIKLKGRNEARSGGLVTKSQVDESQPIELRGRS
ncbi:hypothetical protein PUN50_11270 [Vibrio campbellii]|uniref:DUF5666 domain-containing protein n=1 Tax=Vibrio campbellii TaxID=680 RepID=A0AAQ2XWN7_9VIBR|nr:hypothetical protein [Vibrio campbellii]WDG07330.1 hypothetical protein PUN50_11270 [Vibrio campbellii]